MKQYEYMVVYQSNLQKGRMCITTSAEVSSYDDVEELDRTVRKHNGMQNAFVIDFKLLREYEVE